MLSLHPTASQLKNTSTNQQHKFIKRNLVKILKFQALRGAKRSVSSQHTTKQPAASYKKAESSPHKSASILVELG